MLPEPNERLVTVPPFDIKLPYSLSFFTRSEFFEEGIEVSNGIAFYDGDKYYSFQLLGAGAYTTEKEKRLLDAFNNLVQTIEWCNNE